MKNRFSAVMIFLAAGLSARAAEDFSAASLVITEPSAPATPAFYQKELVVLGIPIQGSQKVSDAALRRAAGAAGSRGKNGS